MIFTHCKITHVEHFLASHSEEVLEKCLREQLVNIAEHYQIEVGDKRLKENFKSYFESKVAGDESFE